jgi:hypothetical protein
MLVFAVVISAAFCLPHGMAQPDKEGLKVTVLLFSGRPDPEYRLAGSDMLERLKTSLGAAREQASFDKPTVIPAILGYKGILVDNDAGLPGIPARFAVYRGMIEVQGEKTKFLSDEGGALESFLLNQAIARGAIDEKMARRIKEGTYSK